MVAEVQWHDSRKTERHEGSCIESVGDTAEHATLWRRWRHRLWRQQHNGGACRMTGPTRATRRLSYWRCATMHERRCHLQLQHESDEGEQSCNIVDTFTARWVLTTRSASLAGRGYDCACWHGNLKHFGIYGERLLEGGSSGERDAWEPDAECNGQPGGFNNTAVRVVAMSGAASVTPGDVVIIVDTAHRLCRCERLHPATLRR